MRKFNLHPLTAAFIGLASSSLYAAETEATHQLSTIVVTASGFEQKITDAPASISVITKEELEKKPYMTLLDAVRDLEGVDIGETRDKTGQGTISMRGMGADYTLILVDGKRQNNHGDIYPNNFGGNQFNHIPPLDAIELNRQSSLQLEGIGVSIRPDRSNEDYTKIETIVEGGPASKSGQVKSGDRNPVALGQRTRGAASPALGQRSGVCLQGAFALGGEPRARSCPDRSR